MTSTTTSLKIIKKKIKAPNPKKDRLIPRKQEKRFLDDPSRIIEPHEFGDFRKELLQVLQEVKQEANSRDPHNGDELDPSKYRFRPWNPG